MDASHHNGTGKIGSMLATSPIGRQNQKGKLRELYSNFAYRVLGLPRDGRTWIMGSAKQ